MLSKSLSLATNVRMGDVERSFLFGDPMNGNEQCPVFLSQLWMKSQQR